MRRLLHLGTALALILGACQDSSNPTAPDQASDRARAGAPRNPTGAVYVQTNGALTLLEAVAGRTAEAQGPRDQDFGRDGRYLYVLDVGFANPATRAINSFRVKRDGRLKKVGTFPLPAFPAVADLAAN